MRLFLSLLVLAIYFFILDHYSSAFYMYINSPSGSAPGPC